jgi:hypothetical protein
MADKNQSEKKWYSSFISFEPDGEGEASSQKPGTPSAAQRVSEIAASLGAAPKFTAQVSTASSFQEVYAAAEIPTPPLGFTIFKVAEMLESPHLKNLPSDVKRSSILVALDAAGVPLQSIVEDAVRRDRALDTFETLQLRSIQELEATKNKENQQIQEELDRLVAEHKKRIQANQEAVFKARQRFDTWQRSKQEEEQKIYDALSPFVTDNPVTTSRHPAPPGGSDAKKIS